MLHISLSLFCTPTRQHLGPLCVLWVMVCCQSTVVKYFRGNSRQRKVMCSNICQLNLEKSWLLWKTEIHFCVLWLSTNTIFKNIDIAQPINTLNSLFPKLNFFWTEEEKNWIFSFFLELQSKFGDIHKIANIILQIG